MSPYGFLPAIVAGDRDTREFYSKVQAAVRPDRLLSNNAGKGVILMKKFVALLLMCVMLCPMVVQAQVITDISLGSASSGGAWYSIGAALTDLINKSDIGIQASLQTTGGSIENCKLVSKGSCEIAIAIGYHAYNAQNGVAEFEGAKMDNLTLMFSGLSVGVMQVIVPGSSTIKTMADLKGKRVAVGPAGGGAITTLTACLEYYGVGYDEITPTYVAYDEGVTMMTDSNVDAAIVYAGVPTAAVQTLQAGGKDFRILSLTKEEQEAILANYTYFTGVSIAAGVYGLTEDVLTIGTPNVVLVNADMPEDLVYKIMETYFSDEGLEAIHNSQSSARGLTLEKAAASPCIEFHPGALKFFTDKGLR